MKNEVDNQTTVCLYIVPVALLWTVWTATFCKSTMINVKSRYLRVAFCMSTDLVACLHVELYAQSPAYRLPHVADASQRHAEVDLQTVWTRYWKSTYSSISGVLIIAAPSTRLLYES